MLGAKKVLILLLLIVFFSATYRAVLILHGGFPPGADIGLHESLIHSITQGGNTNFMWNYYHMGGGSSNTFPGYHIFVTCVVFFTNLPDYLAEVLVAILFSSLLVIVAFLLTRRFLNEKVALVVAFLVGISYYDIFILLWSGYPNIITLLLIPLFFYLLLEKSRFSLTPRVAVASLLSSAIFLTHSLSAFLFIAIIIPPVFIALCFPQQMQIGRKDALEWLIPLFIGGLTVSPFLFQAAPFYLDLNSSVYTGGLPGIQALLLPIRLIPLEFVIPFFAGCFLCFIFFKFMNVKLSKFSSVLFFSWLIIPTILTQSYFLNFYMDYERFLYFATLPLIISVGAGIVLFVELITKKSNRFISAIKNSRERSTQNKISRTITAFSAKKIMATLIAILLIVIIFFELPHFSMTASDGFRLQAQLQVMNQPGFEAIQWIKDQTRTDSVFVADALYGWWLGGFAQRQTVSAVEPVFLTNSREFKPALLATRLLDTDFLIDNGLCQIKEDGGYLGNRNPEFLVKLSDSYYPAPFLNFDSNQMTVTFNKSGVPTTRYISDLFVKEMQIKYTNSTATISITRGNELLNFTQKITVYQGIRFVNITEDFSSCAESINFVDFNLTAQTRGNVVAENNVSVLLKDPYINIGGQLIFTEKKPILTQFANSSLELHFVFNTETNASINFYLAAFEYPNLDSNKATQAELYNFFTSNIESYLDKVSNLPMDIFDYRQALTTLNASYIVVRDFSQVPRFVKDPIFSSVFANHELTIFSVNNID
jgi:hypothetical protein